MLDLCEREGVRHEDVEALGARASTMTLKVLRYRAAATGLEGKFSMPFCLASAVVDGKVGVGQFREESVARPEIDQLQRKVEFELDPELAASDPESERTEVWLRMKGGRELRAREDIARGHIDRPIPQRELREKFIECATEVLPADRADAAWEGWWNMPDVTDIGELTPLLVAS
jgi:2-methylcitrate dehydratase PrpD